MDSLSSVLDRIETVKQLVPSDKSLNSKNKEDSFQEKDESSRKDEDISKPTEPEISANTVDVSSSEVLSWYEFIDPSSGKSYFHNYSTSETSWEAPARYVPYSSSLFSLSSNQVYETNTSANGSLSAVTYPLVSPAPYSQPVDYTTVAYFNQNDGRFGGVGLNHWEQKGLPNDRGLRQLAKFVDLNELERNREETKAKKAQIQNQMKGIDWKKYKEEKKELKKRKRYAWMLED